MPRRRRNREDEYDRRLVESRRDEPRLSLEEVRKRRKHRWAIQENDPAFIASIAKARKQIAAGDTISLEDLKRELGD